MRTSFDSTGKHSVLILYCNRQRHSRHKDRLRRQRRSHVSLPFPTTSRRYPYHRIGPTLNWNHMESAWRDGITNHLRVSESKKKWVFVRPCAESLIAMKNINYLMIQIIVSKFFINFLNKERLNLQVEVAFLCLYRLDLFQLLSIHSLNCFAVWNIQEKTSYWIFQYLRVALQLFSLIAKA